MYALSYVLTMSVLFGGMCDNLIVFTLNMQKFGVDLHFVDFEIDFAYKNKLTKKKN